METEIIFPPNSYLISIANSLQSNYRNTFRFFFKYNKLC